MMSMNMKSIIFTTKENINDQWTNKYQTSKSPSAQKHFHGNSLSTKKYLHRQYVCFLSMSLLNIRWWRFHLCHLNRLNRCSPAHNSTKTKAALSYLALLHRIDLNFAGSIFPFSFFILRGKSSSLGFFLFHEIVSPSKPDDSEKERQTGDFGHKLVSRRSIKEEKFVFDKAVEVRLCSFYVGDIKMLFSLPVLGHRTGWVSSSRNVHIYTISCSSRHRKASVFLTQLQRFHLMDTKVQSGLSLPPVDILNEHLSLKIVLFTCDEIHDPNSTISIN